MTIHPVLERRNRDATRMKSSVCHDDSFREAQSRADVGDRASNRSNAKSADLNDFVGNGFCPVDSNPGPHRDTGRSGHCDLDRIARLNVKAVQPRGRKSRENCA